MTCPLAVISRHVTSPSEPVARLCTLPQSYATVPDLPTVSGWRAGCGTARAAPMSISRCLWQIFYLFSYRIEPKALPKLQNLRNNYLIPQKPLTFTRRCQNSIRCMRETLQLVAPRFSSPAALWNPPPPPDGPRAFPRFFDRKYDDCSIDWLSNDPLICFGCRDTNCKRQKLYLLFLSNYSRYRPQPRLKNHVQMWSWQW